MVVIDGQVGYVGGFNLSEEKYISKIRSSSVIGAIPDLKRYTAKAVIGLQLRFAQDLIIRQRGKSVLRTCVIFNEADGMPGNRRRLTVWWFRLFPVGPDTQTRQIRDNYLETVSQGETITSCQTPYFVPDDATVLSAIQIAARSGVVRGWWFPCKPDHPVCILGDLFVCGRPLGAGGQMLYLKMVSFMRRDFRGWL